MDDPPDDWIVQHLHTRGVHEPIFAPPVLPQSSELLTTDEYVSQKKAAMDQDCFLCQARFETPVIRESPLWVTFINRNQNLLGKTVIALRRHEVDVTGLRLEEWAELRDEVLWVTKRVQEAFAPDHFNYAFLMNFDPHVHLHVIPRYVGTRELAGVEFTDPDYPDSYRAPSATADVASREVIDAVGAALRSSIREASRRGTG